MATNIENELQTCVDELCEAYSYYRMKHDNGMLLVMRDSIASINSMLVELEDRAKVSARTRLTVKRFDDAGLRYCVSNDGISHTVCEKECSCIDCDENDSCPIYGREEV